MTDHAIAVGGDAVEQHDPAQLFEARYDVPIGRSLLEEEVEVCHTDARKPRMCSVDRGMNFIDAQFHESFALVISSRDKQARKKQRACRRTDAPSSART